jgi:hypothetical protein
MFFCYGIGIIKKSMEGAPQKKERSASQQAAFLKCKEARDRAIIQKHEAQKALTKEPVAESVPEQEESVHEPVKAPTVAVSIAQAPPQEEEQYCYVDFDPDHFKNDIFSKLNSYEKQIQDLHAKYDGLHGQHNDLDQTFRQHNIKQTYATNFVD